MTTSRRDALKIVASAIGTVSVPPLALAIPETNTGTLLERVQKTVDGIPQERINEALHGPYAEVFRIAKSTMQTEQVVQYRMPGSVASGFTNAVVREIDEEREYGGQRFVYCASTSECSFGFTVVPDDDPRAASHLTPDLRAGIYSLFELKTETAQPWRFSDLGAAIARLIWVMKDNRDQDAVSVLNNGHVYDGSLAGDGVSLLCTPFEIEVVQDAATGVVIVKVYERRCFTYTDPRAVFGCIPPRTSQGI